MYFGSGCDTDLTTPMEHTLNQFPPTPKPVMLVDSYHRIGGERKCQNTACLFRGFRRCLLVLPLGESSLAPPQRDRRGPVALQRGQRVPGGRGGGGGRGRGLLLAVVEGGAAVAAGGEAGAVDGRRAGAGPAFATAVAVHLKWTEEDNDDSPLPPLANCMPLPPPPSPPPPSSSVSRNLTYHPFIHFSR